MKYLVLFSTIIALFLCSCAKTTTTELTVEQKTTIEKEVRDQFDGLESAINQLDFDTWSKYWSKDEFISISSGVNYFQTFSSWADSVVIWWSQRKAQHGEPLEISVKVLTPTLALNTMVADGEIWTKSDEHIQMKFINTLLWKKEQDTWKVVLLHESWQEVN